MLVTSCHTISPIPRTHSDLPKSRCEQSNVSLKGDLKLLQIVQNSLLDSMNNPKSPDLLRSKLLKSVADGHQLPDRPVLIADFLTELCVCRYDHQKLRKCIRNKDRLANVYHDAFTITLNLKRLDESQVRLLLEAQLHALLDALKSAESYQIVDYKIQIEELEKKLNNLSNSLKDLNVLLRKILKFTTDNPPLLKDPKLREILTKALETGDLTALQKYIASLNEPSDPAYAVYLQGQAAEQNGDIQQAYKHYKRASDMAKKNRSYAIKAGNVALQLEYLSEAKDFFTLALDSDQLQGNVIQIAEDYNYLGVLSKVQHKDLQAKNQFQKAYDLSHEAGAQKHPCADIYTYNLSQASFSTNHFDNAVKYYQEALVSSDLKRRFGAQLITNFGYLYHLQGKYSAALSQYRLALTTQPTSALLSKMTEWLARFARKKELPNHNQDFYELNVRQDQDFSSIILVGQNIPALKCITQDKKPHIEFDAWTYKKHTKAKFYPSNQEVYNTLTKLIDKLLSKQILKKRRGKPEPQVLLSTQGSPGMDLTYISNTVKEYVRTKANIFPVEEQKLMESIVVSPNFRPDIQCRELRELGISFILRTFPDHPFDDELSVDKSRAYRIEMQLVYCLDNKLLSLDAADIIYKSPKTDNSI